MNALHHLNYIMPSRVVVKNKAWTPTVADSKNAFFNMVKNEHSIIAKMNSRKIACNEKKIQEHPMIFEFEVSKNVEYRVGLGDATYECESFIDAVEAAFKCFVTFKIPFPPECANLWHFLNQIFYKIDLHQKPSAKMISILNSYKL